MPFRRSTSRVALILLTAAVAFIFAVTPASATIDPKSVPIPDPACSIKVSSSGFKSGGGLGYNIKYYYVTFSKTCGYPVSSYYHANLSGFFAGTQWLYGPNVVGSSGTSQVDTQLQGACTYGWRYQNSSGWHNVKLGGGGC